MPSIIKFIFIYFCLFLFLGVTVQSVIIESSTKIKNVTYRTNKGMNFHTVSIDSNYMMFNTTKFFVESNNPVTITIDYLNDNINDADYKEETVGFYAASTNEVVWFNISGFPIGNDYKIEKNDVLYSSVNVNNTGYISFKNLQEKLYNFQIFRVENWDMNCDEHCTLIDLLLVSNYYNERGSIGWIREDIDDNGAITVLDLSIISNYYGDQ